MTPPMPQPVSLAMPPGLQEVSPLQIIRTETVLSRLPIHTLAKTGTVAIHIRRTNAQGDVTLAWTVSPNPAYGVPRQLAYKLDTLVINQRVDQLGRPLPRLLRLGSLTALCATLGSHKQEVKRALYQNATTAIAARVQYRGQDGTPHCLEAVFTRYSVLWTGQRLPDGTCADAVYLVLSEPYWEVLNTAPVRPLNYAYLKALTPAAQRFYELLSYQMFAALKYARVPVVLRYGDYCLFAAQQRYLEVGQVQKQMYKIHQPHLQAGYLTRVQYTATTDAAGQPDWRIAYTPGSKARSEYTAFMRQPGAEAAAALVAPGDAVQDECTAPMLQVLPSPRPPQRARARMVASPARGAMPTMASLASPPPATLPPSTLASSAPAADPLEAQAQALVDAFHQRFHGRAPGTAHPKELAHAMQLLTEHGETKAHFLLTYAQQTAPETAYQPKFFGGILPYLPEALAAYDAQARQAAQRRTQQAAAHERRRHERYLAWQQEQCAQLRAALPSTALMALEDAQRARLRAAGTALVALDIAVRVAIDNVLAAQAQLPTFEVWRQQEAAC